MVNHRKRGNSKSYADAVRRKEVKDAPVTGANAIPLQHQRLISTKTVFDRLVFRRISAFKIQVQTQALFRKPAQKESPVHFCAPKIHVVQHCARCLSTGHDRRHFRNLIKCHGCRESGHVQDRCPRRPVVTSLPKVKPAGFHTDLILSTWEGIDVSNWFSTQNQQTGGASK